MASGRQSLPLPRPHGNYVSISGTMSLLFREPVYKPLQRLSDINHMRVTGSPWPCLRRVIVLRRFISPHVACRVLSGLAPLCPGSGEPAEFSFIIVLTTLLRNAARRGFAL